jgi:cholest-4-en-3-one 26-monooxygenase
VTLDADVDLSHPDTYRHGFPHELFRRLRAESPISWREEPGGPGYWAVTRYDDAVEVLSKPTLFSSWLGGVRLPDPPAPFLHKLRESLLNRDPPEHTALRAVVNKGFTGARMQRLRERIRAHARELVARVEGRGTCDFATEIAGEMPLFVICELLGVPAADRAHLYALTARMFNSEIGDAQAAFADAMAAAEEMRAYGAAFVRQKPSGEDVMSDLLGARPGGCPLGQGELQAFFALLFAAGADTTRTLLCLGLDLLLDRPETLTRLASTPALIPMAIEEMLRFEPPVLHFRRTASADGVLRGKAIAAGQKVVVFFPSANRDETVFAEADEFIIDRSPNAHLAFGHGVHQCLGGTLARIQATHVLGTLLGRVREIERRGPKVEARTNFVRSVHRLPIAFRAI